MVCWASLVSASLVNSSYRYCWLCWGGSMPLLFVGGFRPAVIVAHVASKVHWVLKSLWDVLLQPRMWITSCVDFWRGLFRRGFVRRGLFRRGFLGVDLLGIFVWVCFPPRNRQIAADICMNNSMFFVHPKIRPLQPCCYVALLLSGPATAAAVTFHSHVRTIGCRAPWSQL